MFLLHLYFNFIITNLCYFIILLFFITFFMFIFYTIIYIIHTGQVYSIRYNYKVYKIELYSKPYMKQIQSLKV